MLVSNSKRLVSTDRYHFLTTSLTQLPHLRQSSKAPSFSSHFAKSFNSSVSTMVYSYAPTYYYSTLHESVTSLCKSLLPFSFKKRRLPAAEAEHKLLKLQSDNLKWQQDSFHQILNLMGLRKEGILAEAEVSAFRSSLLHSLTADTTELEKPVILRDKLRFLQELLYAKCISEDEYYSSKRPLLQRLAAQGAEIEARDVIVSGETPRTEAKETIAEEEWSFIDLKDDTNKEEGSNSKSRKHGSAMKQIKGGAALVLGFVSPHKHGKNKEERSIFDLVNTSNSEASSILMPESLPCAKDTSVSSETTNRKPFRKLFQKEQKDGNGEENRVEKEQQQQQTPVKSSAKKKWGIDGLKKKWKRNAREDETTPLHLDESSDEVQDTKLEVVKKEFKDHDAGELESLKNAASEKPGINSAPWTTFHDDEDENCHPNLFANNDRGITKFHETNPFCDDHITSNASKLRAIENQEQNPFWVPGHGY